MVVVGNMRNLSSLLSFFLVCCVSLCAQYIDEHRIPYPYDGFSRMYEYYYQSKDNNLQIGLHFKDTVPVQEMIDSFYSHIKNPHIVSPFIGRDSARYIYDTAVLSLSPLKTYPKEAESVRGLRGVWDLFKEVKLIGLYSKDGALQQDILDSLEPKYRKLAGHWSGNLFAWLSPVYYMGFIVSPRLMLNCFRKGEKVLLEVYQGPTDYFSYASTKVFFDGSWCDRISESSYMLSHTMSSTPFLPFSYLHSRDTSVTFSILLYDTGEGFYDARLLLPEEPDRNIQEIFKELQFGLRRMQRRIYRPYYTTDFRLMTGRYYFVTFDRRGWWFKDYMEFYEEDFILGK